MSRRRREPWPDVLHIWRITWTKRGDVWEGPLVGGPDDRMLREAVRYERIEVRGDRYVMGHPERTMDRTTWYEGDVEISRPSTTPQEDV
jgi:hypothetical protein